MSTGATALKAYFVAGAEPTAVQFAELIDGNLNLNDGGTVKGPVYNSTQQEVQLHLLLILQVQTLFVQEQ